MALAAVLALGTWVYAQPAAGAPAGPCGGCPQAAGEPDAPGITDAAPMPVMPTLTTEQWQKTDELRVKHLREVLPLQTDLRVKEIELDALWRAEELDGNKLLGKVKEINDVRNKLELARVNHQLAMYRLLTPEQRKQARCMFGRCPQGMGGRMGQGMGMRGMGRMRGMGMGQGVMMHDCQSCPEAMPGPGPGCGPGPE
jgi:Spy/CpxP family protein refolding chaperone